MPNENESSAPRKRSYSGAAPTLSRRVGCRSDALQGTILGTMVGDALGLPYEALSPRRARRLLGAPTRHRLVAGRGMVSDDTEHTWMVAQALIQSPNDPQRFQKRLARSMRWWFLALPGGVGLATLKASLKICLGFPSKYCGVRSAGNGPAMRSALLGVTLGDTPEEMCRFVRASTELTHTDPRAFHGALAVAVAAWINARAEKPSPERFIEHCERILPSDEGTEMLDLLKQAVASATDEEPVADFAQQIGSRKGISGFICHTVPCVVQTWLRHPADARAALTEIIETGGDTDTTGAILGAIVGARVGADGIPAEWLNRIAEWPRTVDWTRRLASALAARLDGDQAVAPPSCFRPAIPLRNIAFLAIVLTHGFRRLFPPY